MMTMMRRLPTATASLTTALSWRFTSLTCRPSHQLYRASPNLISSYPRIAGLSVFGSTNSQISNPIPQESSKHGPLQPGLYLVGTPIGNLEDITLRALRVLKSADVILSEDTRHSGKLLQHYNITTPLLSYHKFNESQREQSVLKRLKQGEIVVLISDAGTPGISDPGTELAKLCVGENIPVIPIPGPCAVVAALSASGLATDEFTFVGFLPKHAGSRKERLAVSAKETRTQIFYVPPHKLSQFLEEMSSLFVDSRRCVIAREMTKLHEEFWRGTLAEAKEQFSDHQPKGEITLLIEGKAEYLDETPSEGQLELELRDLISSGHSLSMWQEQDMVMLVIPPKPVGMVLQCFSKAVKKIVVQFDQELVTINHVVPCYNHAVKLVAEATSVKRKTIYSLALRKFGKQIEAEDSSN